MNVRKGALKAHEQFIKDRTKALMDYESFPAYCEKYDITMPDDERIVIAAWHKARIECKSVPLSEREKSAEWLIQHGFKVGIR